MLLQIAVEKVRWLAAGLLELNGCDADIAQDVAEHMICLLYTSDAADE